jgi:hypothetical protein
MKHFGKILAAYLSFTCILFGILAPVCIAQSKSQVTELKVKIEATELDRKMLLEGLNADGAGHHLKFTLTEQDFDYRVVFSTTQEPYSTAYGDMNSSTASTSVFDFNGKELFEFKRQGRSSDKRATNAVAKEIIKRLVQLRLPTAN